MQTSGKRTCSQFPECSLSSAKIMQTSATGNNGKIKYPISQNIWPHEAVTN